jgi:hypothetical protein
VALAQGVAGSRILLLPERSLLHLDVDVLEDLLDLLLGGVLAGPRWRRVPRRGGIDLDEAAAAVGLADREEGPMSCSATTSMTVSLTTRNELDADGTGDEVQSAPARRGTDRRRDRVIQAVNSRPGVELSALAPLVSAAYRDGDPQARSIVENAAAALLATLGRIRDPAETTPILLAGSLTSDTSPVGSTLRRLLPARFAGSVRPARSGVGGAAWLALAVLDPALATRDAHARLCA